MEDEPKYDRARAEQILERAAELEGEVPSAGERMTLADLENVARESGIDPQLVRRAAADLERAEKEGTEGFSWLGGPSRLIRTVTIDAPDDLELVADLAADGLGDMGTSRSREGRLYWRTTGQSGRAVELVARTTGSGRVSIQITENLGPLIGSYFGGIGGGVGGGLGGGLAWLFGAMFGGVGVAVWLVFAVSLALGIARALFSRVAARRAASLDELVEQMRRISHTPAVELDFSREEVEVDAQEQVEQEA